MLDTARSMIPWPYLLAIHLLISTVVVTTYVSVADRADSNKKMIATFISFVVLLEIAWILILGPPWYWSAASLLGKIALQLAVAIFIIAGATVPLVKRKRTDLNDDRRMSGIRFGLICVVLSPVLIGVLECGVMGDCL